MAIAPIAISRREFCERQIAQLRSGLASIPSLSAFPNLTVYCTGSYARFEASAYSDLDIFFLHTGPKSELDNSRINKFRLFAAVIERAGDMSFPKFSNDGEFLSILCMSDMLDNLGSREDDYLNYFTARMLLLLESAPLAGEDRYKVAIRKIVESYFRDPDHPTDFNPTFLVNDIIRFWKTICLNYEHKRNQSSEEHEKRLKQKIRNFKLKFSRMLTCFGTTIAVCRNHKNDTA